MMAAWEPKNVGTWADPSMLDPLALRSNLFQDRLQLALLEACSTLQGKGLTGIQNECSLSVDIHIYIASFLPAVARSPPAATPARFTDFFFSAGRFREKSFCWICRGMRLSFSRLDPCRRGG